MKLTAQQEKAMRGLAEGDNDAYSLRVSLSTMDALRRHGLVKSRSGLGSSFSPRTAIKWSLTAQGRAWIEAHSTQEAA